MARLQRVRGVVVVAIALTLPACDGASSRSELPATADETEADTEDQPMAKPSDAISAGTVEIDDIAHLPLPGTVIPGAISFTPDDEHLVFLFSDDGSLSRQMFALDFEGGERRKIVEPPGGGATEENLSPEEKLRRERQRTRALGIPKYLMPREHLDTESNNPRDPLFLVPIVGDLYLQSGLDGELRKRVDMEGPAIDARFSPDGSAIAFVHEDELFVVETEGDSPPKPVTSGAKESNTVHALAEYVAQEEMDRDHGYWWSTDGQSLAYTEVDSAHIPKYRIVHQGKAAVGSEAQEDHRYPFAGAPNAHVRLGVVARSGGKTRWMDLGDDPDIYLARVHWMPDGSLLAQVENREQSKLELLRFDVRTGKSEVLLTERSDIWINLHHLFRPLREQAPGSPLEGAFLWGSEKTGWRHLYLVGPDGEEIRALTKGEWMVESLVAVDEAKGKLYVLGTKDGPLERHLYELSLDGGEPRKLTDAPGMHSAVIDHQFLRFVDSWSSTEQPPTVTVRSLENGKELSAMHDPAASPDPALERLSLTPPEFVTLKTRDGVELHGAVYRPDPKHHGEGPFPTVVSVYGGPHAQRVSNSWGLTVDMRAQYLRDHGYLVFKLDNRGSARRGLEFEGALRHDMGNIEIQDQVDGVRYLVERGLADPARIAIYGWSYGGYMAAMALARAPDTFQVGIAGAPVTHWDGYDTHYTERYMGTPASNPDGYERSSVMHHVENMKGRLLLVHGLIDENVHFRHTARLINALIEHEKDYRLLLFPDERHSPRKPADRIYMERQIFDFLAESLGTAKPQ